MYVVAWRLLWAGGRALHHSPLHYILHERKAGGENPTHSLEEVWEMAMGWHGLVPVPTQVILYYIPKRGYLPCNSDFGLWTIGEVGSPLNPPVAGILIFERFFMKFDSGWDLALALEGRLDGRCLCVGEREKEKTPPKTERR